MSKRIAIIDTPLRHDILSTHAINKIGQLNTFDPKGEYALHGSFIVCDLLESLKFEKIDIDYYPGLDSSGKTTTEILLDLLWQISLIKYDVLLLSLAFDDDTKQDDFNKVLALIENNGTLIICSAFNNKQTIGTLAKSFHTVGIIHHPGIAKGHYKYLTAPKKLYFTDCSALHLSFMGELIEKCGTSFFVPKLAVHAIQSVEFYNMLVSDVLSI